MAQEQDPRSPRAAVQAFLAVTVAPIAPLAAPTVAPAVAGGAAGNVDVGTHQYGVTYIKARQESELGPIVALVISASAKHGSLTAVPLSPDATVTGRNIYRTVAANTTDFRLVGTIADNTTTTFDDNIADVTLNANAAVPLGGQPEADAYQEHGRRGRSDGGL
jgi:hypothetical protein